MKNWQKELIQEARDRNKGSAPSRDSIRFPLIDQPFDEGDILSMVEVIISGQLTMSHRVREFEKQFAEQVGAPYAVMVNSGSSANLLAFAVALNFRRSHNLKSGDEVLIPAVCWSTSLWPIIQLGLKPVFVDVDPNTLNISVKDLKKKITPQTKALLSVHILGNCSDMHEVDLLVKEHGLVHIEDTCESLGSKFGGRSLGTLGDLGTYSFYYSHHMTTGEGGMVVCKTLEDYDLLKCLRAHGWTRELSNRGELEKKYSHIDPRFLFVNAGFNLRPMEIQAALGLSQLKKLTQMNSNRVLNQNKLVAALKSHELWKNQFSFIETYEKAEPIWFGFTLLLNPKYGSQKQEFLAFLSSKGVENRPVVSGNFVRQPALKELGLACEAQEFPGAEFIDACGLFIGIHTVELTSEQVEYLCHTLLSYKFTES